MTMPYGPQLCGGELRPEDLGRLEKTGRFVAEEKYDGIYCIAEVGIESPRYWSRHGKTKDYDLPAFPHRAVLVGELAYGSQAATAAARNAGHGLFWVFDVLSFEGNDATVLPTSHRRLVLDKIFRALPADLRRYYVLAGQRHSGFRAFYEEIVGRGGEGIILKEAPGEPWRGGVRVKHWHKVKKELTVDAVVMGVEESTSLSYKGKARSLIIGQYDASGRLVEIGRASGLEARERDVFWKMRDQIAGKVVVEVKCNEVFRSGSLRHPNFVRVREDKRPEECVLRSVET